MITERCRISFRDTVLVFLATFVLVSANLAPRILRQTVIVDEGDDHPLAYCVPIDHADLPVIRHRLESYGQPIDHPLLGTNRWIAEASRFYASAAEPLWKTEQPKAAIRQVSHQIAEPAHLPAVRSWNRIADEADTRIEKLTQYQSQLLQDLRPAPVKLGSVVRLPWNSTSLLISLAVAALAVAIVAIWQRFCPSRELQSRSETGRELEMTGEGWMAFEVLPQWIEIHQTFGVMLRRGFVLMLVVMAMTTLLSI
jgi:hypothetical protein